jgi:hypothetical protein
LSECHHRRELASSEWWIFFQKTLPLIYSKSNMLIEFVSQSVPCLIRRSDWCFKILSLSILQYSRKAFACVIFWKD